MRTRHRALTTIAAAALLALPLASCNSEAEDPTSSPTTQEDPPTADPADATPQERVEAYFDASDAAAADGWKDTSYVDDFLVPELAEKQKADDAERAESGAAITGERKLSDWTVTEEGDTATTVEFCDDGTGFEASKDGKPVDINNASLKVVGQFELVRESASEPWMIQQKGYYDEETTCDAHFTD